MYSSKRTNKDTLGRFGLGSKVALSLNIDSYRVINRYNGKKMSFDVYLDKVDPVTPMFSNGNKNDSINLTDDCVAYFEQTTEKNGLELEIEIKKHNKKQVFEAIESQLMYMPDIKFLHRANGSLSYEEVDISAEVLYRDQNIVISESLVYDKPHILLGTNDALVNYGFIAFNELEIEPKRGAVGLIMDINDIEVTPSREAPIWSAKTREAVLKKYESVAKTAADYINKELATEKDYVQWLVKASQTMSALRSGNNDSVIGRLASIIDVSSLNNVSYPLDRTIEYEKKINMMMGNNLSVRVVSYNKYAKEVNRNNISSLDTLSLPIYFTKNNANQFVDRYIYEDVGDFVLIQGREGYRTDKMAKLVLSSSKIQHYDNIVVPEDVLDMYKLDEKSDTDGTAVPLTPAQRARVEAARRRAEAKVVLHVAKTSSNNVVFSSEELKVSELTSNFENKTRVVYGNGTDRNFMKHIAEAMPSGYFNGFKASSYYYNSDKPKDSYEIINSADKVNPVDFVLISNANDKYLANSSRFISLDNFIIKSYNKKTGKLVLSDDIKFILTASYARRLFNNRKSSFAEFRPGQMKFVDKDFNNFADTFNYSWVNRDIGALSDINDSFLHACMELAAIDAGFYKSDRAALLETINNEVPSCLCDTIDYISSVDALFLDKLNYIYDKLNIYDKFKPILALFSSKYYYNGDNEAAKTGKLIKELITLKNKSDDEVIQQQDNSSNTE
jgi:hypothetical protein